MLCLLSGDVVPHHLVTQSVDDGAGFRNPVTHRVTSPEGEPKILELLHINYERLKKRVARLGDENAIQRRVPEGLRGRVSSLDFFASLALTPVSMALAGPAGAVFGIATVFIVAGIVPVFLSVAAILYPRLYRDEIENPL